MAKTIEMTEAQRKAAAELARLLPTAARIKDLRAELKPLTDAGAFDKPYTDEESGLTFSVKIARSLMVEAA